MFRRLGQTLVMLTLLMAASAPVLAQGYLGVGLGANFFRDAEYFEIEEAEARDPTWRTKSMRRARCDDGDRGCGRLPRAELDLEIAGSGEP